MFYGEFPEKITREFYISVIKTSLGIVRYKLHLEILASKGAPLKASQLAIMTKNAMAGMQQAKVEAYMVLSEEKAVIGVKGYTVNEYLQKAYLTFLMEPLSDSS